MKLKQKEEKTILNMYQLSLFLKEESNPLYNEDEKEFECWIDKWQNTDTLLHLENKKLVGYIFYNDTTIENIIINPNIEDKKKVIISLFNKLKKETETDIIYLKKDIDLDIKYLTFLKLEEEEKYYKIIIKEIEGYLN